MDWTVNDSLYHQFLKWRLKFENILECELAALPEHNNARRSLLGVETLAWTNMCPGA